MNKYFCIKDCLTTGLNSLNEDNFYQLKKNLFYFICDDVNLPAMHHVYDELENEYFGYIFEDKLNNFISFAEWREKRIDSILED